MLKTARKQMENEGRGSAGDDEGMPGGQWGEYRKWVVGSINHLHKRVDGIDLRIWGLVIGMLMVLAKLYLGER